MARARYRARLGAIAVAAAMLAAGAPPSHAQEEPAAPTTVTRAQWKSLRGLLPKYLWLTDSRRRRKAKVGEQWAALGDGRVILDRRQFADLAGVLRAGRPYTTEKSRSATVDVATGATLDDGSEETMPVKVAVSSKYKPGRGGSFPLIITCHGGPVSEMKDALQGSGTQFRLWKGFASTIDCIVAAPALTGSSYGEREATFLANLIDALDERYNVDRDRVLLTGHSWGGILTWHLGPAHADRFALLAPFVCAVNPGRPHLSNLRALPVYHVQGNRDHKWMLETGRERRDLLDALGYEHTYREPNGGHETFGTEIAKIAKAFAGRKRALFAQQIVRAPSRVRGGTSDLWYWVRTADREFTASLDREAGVIEIDADGPFEVFLSDEMLDLDRVVRVIRSGEEVWNGRVERRLDFTLAHVRETGDRHRVFAASVKIE